MGYAGTAPYIVLGGTGLMPMRDQEDAHVLDTAVAGQAHLLVTAHPYPSVTWLREGIFPDTATIEHLGTSDRLVGVDRSV